MDSLTTFVKGRWFPIIELACVSLATILWAVGSVSVYLPVFIALAPWLVRFAAGSSPFKGWGIDIALAVFILTAGIGAWLAYDQPAAIHKFWLLVAAVLLFYAFANQPESNLWLLAGLIGLVGIGFAGYYLLTNDWGIYPSKAGFLNGAGLAWMAVRPTIQSKMIHPNITAGIIGISFPFLAALWLKVWRDKKWLSVVVLSLGLLLLLSVFLLITSRHALVAIGLAAAIGVILLASTHLAGALRWRQWLAFGLVLILVLAIGAVVAARRPTLLQRVVALPTAGSYPVNRLTVTRGALSLIADYAYSGAGLEAFPGQFSTYYLITPNYIISHSYNLFLDVALEQGIVALLAFLWVVLISTFLLFIYGKGFTLPLSSLRWAALFSLMIFFAHAFFDDILYDYRQAPLLLLLSGMAMAVAAPGLAEASRRRRRRLRRKVYLGAGVTILAMLLVGFSSYRSFLADWYANLGALAMARVELSERDWDNSGWKYANSVEDFEPAAELFDRALQHDPGNRIANHRLGLISIFRRDFPAAVAYLSKAYEKNPNHRGIIKVLGLSYIWNGQFAMALPLLEQIPEAKEELGVYRWYWGTNGRNDLASNANNFLSLLSPATAP